MGNGDALYVFVVIDVTVIAGLDDDVLLTIELTETAFVGKLVLVI